MMEVYSPREDSFLLEEVVKKHAFGTVLDLGTGSGIQAIAAAINPNVSSVTAIDINPKALETARENALLQGVGDNIVFKQSDLFSALEGEKFDCIISNPPYLPFSEGEKTGDIALESGKDGREFTDRFLQEFEAHLNPTGIVLLLQSSTSHWNKTREILEAKGLSVKVEARQSFFFEELVVLKADSK